jgi:hypothetical protein
MYWCELTSRVQGIDIDTQIHGLLQSDSFPNLLDDAVGADLVYFACFDDFETAVPVVLVVRGTG